MSEGSESSALQIQKHPLFEEIKELPLNEKYLSREMLEMLADMDCEHRVPAVMKAIRNRVKEDIVNLKKHDENMLAWFMLLTRVYALEVLETEDREMCLNYVLKAGLLASGIGVAYRCHLKELYPELANRDRRHVDYIEELIPFSVCMKTRQWIVDEIAKGWNKKNNEEDMLDCLLFLSQICVMSQKRATYDGKYADQLASVRRSDDIDRHVRSALAEQAKMFTALEINTFLLKKLSLPVLNALWHAVINKIDDVQELHDLAVSWRNSYAVQRGALPTAQ